MKKGNKVRLKKSCILNGNENKLLNHDKEYTIKEIERDGWIRLNELNGWCWAPEIFEEVDKNGNSR